MSHPPNMLGKICVRSVSHLYTISSRVSCIATLFPCWSHRYKHRETDFSTTSQVTTEKEADPAIGDDMGRIDQRTIREPRIHRLSNNKTG